VQMEQSIFLMPITGTHTHDVGKVQLWVVAIVAFIAGVDSAAGMKRNTELATKCNLHLVYVAIHCGKKIKYLPANFANKGHSTQ